jgi:hypothetical protein
MSRRHAFLHDDHGFERAATEAATVLGERRGEQPEFGEFFPDRPGIARLARDDALAGGAVIFNG